MGTERRIRDVAQRTAWHPACSGFAPVGRPASLSVLFDAASVAVVGASNDPSKVGGSVLANLRAGGFAGRIVAVNRARDRVQEMPAVGAITTAGPVDVAVI